jgi:hypothetical protein
MQLISRFARSFEIPFVIFFHMLNKNMYLGKLLQGTTSKEISQQHSSRALQKVQKK